VTSAKREDVASSIAIAAERRGEEGERERKKEDGCTCIECNETVIFCRKRHNILAFAEGREAGRSYGHHV